MWMTSTCGLQKHDEHDENQPRPPAPRGNRYLELHGFGRGLRRRGPDERSGRVAHNGVGAVVRLAAHRNRSRSPETLTTVPADAALQWIPVLTIFEAGARATGLDADLGDAASVTILAPTDEALVTTFSEGELDELLVSRRRALRSLGWDHWWVRPPPNPLVPHDTQEIPATACP